MDELSQNRMIMTLRTITIQECSDLCITAGCLEKAAFLFFLLRSLSFQILFKLVYEGKGEQAKRQEDDDVDAEGTSRNVFCKKVWLQVDEEVQHDRQDHAVG